MSAVAASLIERLREVVRIAGSLTPARSVQPDMTPEDREALIEAGYDPDDPHVQARTKQVERGLKVMRQRWHSHLQHPTAASVTDGRCGC
ncbi:hypothetical protein ACFC06_10585 [Nocardia sp. NPDC056064]|uniref:hypothetical protein n=1 Tax=Nocardia sp. NPDC056064 TaxID=3345701 RepID=UPI0035D539D9